MTTPKKPTTKPVTAISAMLAAKRSEGQIKAEANSWSILRGWWTIKVETPTMNGVPDHIYVRRGITRWVEWKKPGGVLSEQQLVRIAELRKHGAEVMVFDNIEDFKKWMY